jgi:hypothetical protein
MRTQRRWSFVPKSRVGCALLLLFGVIFVIYNVRQMVVANDIAILPAIALVLGLVIIATGLVGLLAPRLRRR